jgi:hypothetical protein
MNYLHGFNFCLCISSMLLLAVACGKTSPPTPLSTQELPAALQKTFQKAPPALNKLANQAANSFQNKDFAKAFLELQQLNASPDLTKEQRLITARGLLTANKQLQAAQAQGDQRADQLLKLQQLSK